MKKGVILFDIDRTILDTEKMAFKFQKLFATLLKVNLEDIQQMEIKYIDSLRKDRDFTTQGYTQFMCRSFRYQNINLFKSRFFDERNAHILTERESDKFDTIHSLLELPKVL